MKAETLNEQIMIQINGPNSKPILEILELRELDFKFY